MAELHSVKFEPDIPVMLRDGVITYVDVFRPDVAEPFPALLQRTPYDKSSAQSQVHVLGGGARGGPRLRRGDPGRDGGDSAPTVSSTPS